MVYLLEMVIFDSYYGKIHHACWLNQLFRLGHFQEQTVSLPEGKWHISKIVYRTSQYFNDSFNEQLTSKNEPPIVKKLRGRRFHLVVLAKFILQDGRDPLRWLQDG